MPSVPITSAKLSTTREQCETILNASCTHMAEIIAFVDAIAGMIDFTTPMV